MFVREKCLATALASMTASGESASAGRGNDIVVFTLILFAVIATFIFSLRKP